MSGLPPGWSWASVSDIAAPERNAVSIGPFGSNLKTSDYRASGVPLVFVRNIRSEDFVGQDPKFVEESKAAELAAHWVHPGDVLITKMGDPPGDSCIYPDRPPAVITADCIKLTVADDIDPKFISFAIRSPAVRDSILGITRGVAQRKVSLGRFRNLELPVAPSHEQRRIVEALEDNLSSLEAGVSSLSAASTRIVRLRRRILEDAVAGDWEAHALGEILQSLRNGCFVSRPATEPPGIPIYRISAVRPMALDCNDVRYAPSGLERAGEYLVDEGDLLFTRYSGNPHFVGACAVVPALGAGRLHPDKLIRGVPDPDLVVPEWVALACTASVGRREIERRLKTTAGQVGIAGGQLKTVRIPIPPIEVQHSRLESFRMASDAADRLEHELSSVQRARATGLHRSILAAAFSGQLVPHDPAGEPATDLLERLRREKPMTKRRSKKVPS